MSGLPGRPDATAWSSDGGGYPQPQAGSTSNGLAVAALVCGLVGLLLFSIVLGPLAIVFGWIGMSRAFDGARHQGLAVAGLALGVVDVLLFIFVASAATVPGI